MAGIAETANAAQPVLKPTSRAPSGARFDTIVVGAGSAGSVLAASLVDSGRRVLLIEAGPIFERAEEFPAASRDAAQVPGARPDLPYNWPIPGLVAPGRPYLTTRGRILGGSSATNGAYFIRPRLEDFREWAACGSSEWSYAAALPRLRALEHDLDYPGEAIHGDCGPIGVSRTSLDHPAVAAFAAACAELGAVPEADKNAQAQPGFGPLPRNVVAGVRQNAGAAFVIPALSGGGLALWGDTLVERVVIERGAAVGVMAARGGGHVRVEASEVVLCAGAIRSPQLLMLSGIGPADELARLGIPSVHNAPGVGIGLSDHPQLAFEWMPREAEPAPAGSWLGGVLHCEPSGTTGVEVLQALVPMASLTSDPNPDANGAASEPAGGTGGPNAARTSVQTADRTDTAGGRSRKQTPGPLSFLFSPSWTRRTGRIRVESSDLAASPHVEYGYVDSANERAELRAMARFASHLMGAPALRAAAKWASGPSSNELATDANLDAWVAQHLGTSMHSCATASFGGSNPVVDTEGRVLGVRGLRVADASILPAVPRRGPAVAALLIGATIGELMTDEA